MKTETKTPPKKKQAKTNSNKKTETKKKQTVNSSSKKKKEVKTDKVLLTIFIILLVLVVILFAMVFVKRKENNKTPQANLVFPVYKINTEEKISLKVASLAKEKEYILKITNKKNDQVNKTEMNYNLTIENNSKSKIKVTKDSNPDNLMLDDKAIIIENQKLKANTEENTYYHISITTEKDIKETDTINIKITN